MYYFVNTKEDVLRELKIQGAELTENGFPCVPAVTADGIANLNPVPFSDATKEKNPKKSICHFFIDDVRFERIWNNPQKYYSCLQNFKYVITPDFSACGVMPKVLQMYQYYRNRVMAYDMWVNDVNIIPSCNWGDEKSWEFCFEGLPVKSVIGITTNGRNKNDMERRAFLNGFEEMKRRLLPTKIICVGKAVEGMHTDGNIVFLDSYMDTMKKKMEE